MLRSLVGSEMCIRDRSLVILSCGPINTIPTEIQELTIYLNEKDKESFLDFYEKDKLKFWDAILSDEQSSMEKLRNKMLSKGMDKRMLNDFIPILNSYSKIHKENIIASDIIYKEGLQCLNDIVKSELIEFEKEIRTLALSIQPLIQKSDWKKLKNIHSSQMKLINQRQEHFKDIEVMTNGVLGKNITAYNQLCFQIISRLYCAEYGRENKEDTYELTEKIFNHNNNLYSHLKRYGAIEEKIVNLIETDNCKKRIGILMHYDGLSILNIAKTQKANMLMNVSKFIKN